MAMSLNLIAEFNPTSNIHVFHPFLAKPTPHKLHLVMKMNRKEKEKNVNATEPNCQI